MNFSIPGNIVDIRNKEIYAGTVCIENGIIKSIERRQDNLHILAGFILPGFIDAHVHIESSMIVPSEFARLAVVHGTVGTISDPHEIANVCGLAGVEFMIANGKSVPFKFHFGAPSCVPATSFETAGAMLDAEDVDQLLQKEDIYYLSEMMNFPGVLHEDKQVTKKIASAKKYNKPVDGHAPGLRGEDARRYIGAGISTDHECFTSAEALDKLSYGMKILIREGSAAKNFEALVYLLHEHYASMMLCSDDKHPDSLVVGHINVLCARAVAIGVDVFKVLQAACINPVEHYKMKVGTLRVGDAADFVIVENLEQFKVLQTYIDGALVAENGSTLIHAIPPHPLNKFDCNEISTNDIACPIITDQGHLEKISVIEALDGQLITNKLMFTPKVVEGYMVSDTEEDVLKIVVVNRYKSAPVAKGFIRNFGFTHGSIASSVAHDSHNIIAVGADDESLVKAINLIIRHKGGISCVSENKELVLPLPVAGLMSEQDGYKVAELYTQIDQAAKDLGSKLSAPFMTLSFMALLVIPHIKLSDLGMFDGDAFQFI